MLLPNDECIDELGGVSSVLLHQSIGSLHHLFFSNVDDDKRISSVDMGFLEIDFH